MYKALDVREVIEISSGSVSNHPSYCGSNSMSINTKQKTIVIAENENKKRTRFQFYDGYEDRFLGQLCYYGYKGDFNLLVPGDKFEVRETSTWKTVLIVEDD
jgi:hypothetical protein